MPPKTRAGKKDGSDSDTDVEQLPRQSASSSPSITLSEEMLHSLVSSITTGQAEANRVLIENLLASRDVPCTPPRSSDTRETARRSGNFAKCTSRYDGSSKNAEELEAFIDAIEVYRDCTNISDEHALRGLPMLLVGEAAVWWQGVKSSVTSWSDAIQRLRGMYGVPRPSYKIFRDVFRNEQNSERADVFISKVRALISKLPYNVPEVMLLDIVYGLLDRRIRKRVSRDDVYELEQLIAKARLVEESLAEVSVSTHCNVNNNPSVAAQASSTTSVNPVNAVVNPRNLSNDQRAKRSSESHSVKVENNNTESDGHRRVRPKCSYCKFFGHTVDECRNKEKKDSQVIDPSKSSENTELRCYGCGQLGVVRSKCSNCKNASTSSKSDFCSAQVASDDTRPLVEIQVVNCKGVAILDTGATHSIAGPMLYDLLKEAGVVFRKTSRTIGLADGTQQAGIVLECNIKVKLKHHVIPTTFIVIPHAQTRTLLGRDFIMKASILLDLPQSSWCFNDEPDRWHPFITSFDLPTGGRIELMKVEASNLVLREEGTKLTANQKVQLNTFLVKRSDRFVKGRPPSEYVAHRLKMAPHQEPTVSPLYRMSPGKRAMLDQECQKILHPDARKIVEDFESTDDPFRGRSRSDRAFSTSDGTLYGCEYCVGAVRKQGEGPEERPVEYASRLMNVHEKVQVNQRRYADERRPAHVYSVRDLILLKTLGSNDTTRGQTPKFIPWRDGPYRVKEAVSSSTYSYIC